MSAHFEDMIRAALSPIDPIGSWQWRDETRVRPSTARR